jgi:hypothetical protein
MEFLNFILKRKVFNLLIFQDHVMKNYNQYSNQVGHIFFFLINMHVIEIKRKINFSILLLFYIIQIYLHLRKDKSVTYYSLGL